MTALHLPRELAKMTPPQVEKVIESYVALPLDELRRRQAQANTEVLAAFETSVGGDLAASRAIANAQITVELLAEAVGRQTWPDFRHSIDLGRYRA